VPTMMWMIARLGSVTLMGTTVLPTLRIATFEPAARYAKNRRRTLVRY